MLKKIPAVFFIALWMGFSMVPVSDAGPLEELQKVLPEKVMNWTKAEADQF